MKNALSRKSAILTCSIAAILAISASAPQSARATNYYWDNDDTTAGFGIAGGTWATPTVSQWSTSTDGTGTPGASITTTSADTLTFGNGATGLGTGTITVGTVSASTLTFATGSGTIVLSGGTAIDLAAASTITVNNSANTITTPLTGAGTSLTKLGTGTLTLNGANTYTGTTIIGNGTLQVGDGTTGSLNGTTGTALTFSGTGTFNVKEADNVNQGMGTLSFNAGQGTVKNTFNTTASTLTFSGMNARSAGATANFTTSGGTNGTTNKIVLSDTTNAPMSNSGSNNQGIFFGLDSLSTAVSYARYDATGAGFFRATNYSGDTNATTTAGPYGDTVDLSLGDVTTSPGASVSLNTLRAVPTANGRRFDVGTNTLSINGVLAVVPSAGVQFRVGSTTIGQGFLQPTTDGGEVVFALARGNNAALTTSSLAIANVVQNFSGGSAGTKVTTESNATIILQASNTYTGVTTINSGYLRVLKWADAGSASGLGMGSTGATPNAADIVINGGTLNYGNVTIGTPARTNRLFTIGPAGATLDNSSNTTNTANTLAIGQNSDGSSSGSIAFSDSNAPASLTLAHNAPAANQFGTGTLSAVLGDPGTGTNVTSLTKTNAGTWILTAANTHSGVTRITGGTLQLGNNLALQNSIFDPSGGGTLAFSSGIDTPTLGGLTSATNLTLASNVTALALNPGTGVTATYSGILGSTTPGMTLEKKGAGTQVLSGANTYTGATAVNAGTLLVSGSISGSASTVSNAGSTLGGTGIVGAVTVNSGAILQGGDGLSPSDDLSSGGNVSLNDGSIIKLTLGAANAHSSLTRTDGTWAFDNDQAFTFIGTQAGTFDNIIAGLGGSESNLITGGSTAWNFSDVNWSYAFAYDNAGGVDLTIIAVPEPNVAVTLLGGVAMLLGLRRRRWE